MKRYQTYTPIPCKISSEIPSEWLPKKLKYTLSYTKGRQPVSLTEEAVGDPYATMDYLRGRDGILQYPTSFEDLVHIDENSLLVLWDGANAGEFLKGKPGYLGSTMAVIKPNDFVIKEYLYYLLKASEKVSKQIAGGTTIPHFSPTFFEENFGIPSLPEQQKIVAFLDYKTGKIDHLVEMLNTRIDDLKKYRQSVISETVTRGLDKTAKMKDSGIEWIGEMPETWTLSKAKYIVSINHGRDPQTIGDVPVYGSGSCSFKTCGEYKDGPAVLLGRKGATLHIPHYVEGRYWNVDTAFDVKSLGAFNLRYYYYCAICFDYDRYKSQTTLPGMAQSDYNNMTIPIPTPEEQQLLVDHLDRKNILIDEGIATTYQTIQDLQKYRASLITEAVTGQIDVRDWETPTE